MPKTPKTQAESKENNHACKLLHMHRCMSFVLECVTGKLETHWKSLLGAKRCQELDQNNADYSWSTARETAVTSQAVKTTDGHLFHKTPATARFSSQANLWTWSHALSGLATLPFQRHSFRRWINKSSTVQHVWEGNVPATQSPHPPTSPHLNWFITWGDGTRKWNRPFTRGS